MSTSIYIVIYVNGAWWIDLNGLADGPYRDLEIAMTEAIGRAGAKSREGSRTEVRVSGPGHDKRLVYQSPARSLLGRTVAELHY